MAGTISYSFDPNQTVWVIDDTACDAGLVVSQGAVVRVVGVVLSATTVTYDVRIGTSAGTKAFYQEDVFPTLTAAMNDLELRLAA